MRANRGSSTSLELMLRSALSGIGVRGYRLNARTPAGRPDIVFSRVRLAVFVHGCFWHRCPTCRLPLPKTHRTFWSAKFRRNRARDRAKRALLEAQDWRVIEVWSHEVEANPVRVATTIARTLNRRRFALSR
jgi:DNA mismatch endonuclease (patch repair protein)